MSKANVCCNTNFSWWTGTRHSWCCFTIWLYLAHKYFISFIHVNTNSVSYEQTVKTLIVPVPTSVCQLLSAFCKFLVCSYCTCVSVAVIITPGTLRWAAAWLHHVQCSRIQCALYSVHAEEVLCHLVVNSNIVPNKLYFGAISLRSAYASVVISHIWYIHVEKINWRMHNRRDTIHFFFLLITNVFHFLQ